MCFTYYFTNGPVYNRDKINFEKIKYLLYGEEIAPTTGRLHLQGYVVFHTKQSVAAAQKILGMPDTHFEKRLGTHEQNVTYCKKDRTNIFEWGKYEPGKRTDIERAKEMVLNGASMKEITLETSGPQAARYSEILLKYHERKRSWKPYVRWYWGKTGCGKTETAKKEAGPNRWVADKTLKWWEGYDGEENIVIDDFREHFCEFTELLRILDTTEFRCEFKGGSRQLLAKNIWITSAYPPERVYKNSAESVDQLLGRIDEIVEFEHPDKYGYRSKTGPKRSKKLAEDIVLDEIYNEVMQVSKGTQEPKDSITNEMIDSLEFA